MYKRKAHEPRMQDKTAADPACAAFYAKATNSVRQSGGKSLDFVSVASPNTPFSR
jgi:hypothetical protein